MNAPCSCKVSEMLQHLYPFHLIYLCSSLHNELIVADKEAGRKL